MESSQKRYIVSREPIGTANKHFKDLSTQIVNIEAVLRYLQSISNSLLEKSKSFELKMDKIAETLSVTNSCLENVEKKVTEIDTKKTTLVRKTVKKRRKKVTKGVQTETLPPIDDIEESNHEDISDPPPNLETSPPSPKPPSPVIETPITTKKDDGVRAVLLNTGDDCSRSDKDDMMHDKDDAGVKTEARRLSHDQVTRSSLLLTLNKEEDFPNGCWLGDQEDLNGRVRVSLTQPKLDNLLQTFTTPEKLALALMDKLFSRETMACSNLTGKGKHHKKKLDPLIIYGIYCQLRYIHNISDSDWTRIKKNMESKCRALWRRKAKAAKKLTCNNANNVALHLKSGDAFKDSVEENCGNIVLYPLYQVDSNQLIQVAGLQSAASDKPLQFVSETVGLTETVSDVRGLSSDKEDTAMEVSSGEGQQQQRQVGQLVGGDDGSTAGSSGSAQNKQLDRDGTSPGGGRGGGGGGGEAGGGISQHHQTLTLAGGDLIMTDLGEVISITSEADVDCMMVSSVDYL